MFSNNLNFSKSLLSDVAKIMQEKQETCNLPQCLYEAAKLAGKELTGLYSVEDKRKILRKYFDETVANNQVSDSDDAKLEVIFEKAAIRFSQEQTSAGEDK